MEHAGTAIADLAAARGTDTRTEVRPRPPRPFAWNRLGITPDDQFLLAASVGIAVFGTMPPHARACHGIEPGTNASPDQLATYGTYGTCSPCPPTP